MTRPFRQRCGVVAAVYAFVVSALLLSFSGVGSPPGSAAF